MVQIMARTWLPALLLACVAAPSVLATVNGAGSSGSGPLRLRVLTYNIRHGEGLDGRIDLPRQAAIMKEADPDLIALQEVDRGTARAGGVDQLTELGLLTGMHAVFGKAITYQGGEYGVGVLSRHPILGARNRPLPGSPERERRTALTVEVEPGGRGPRVHFTTTHLDDGRNAMDKVAQASYLAGALSRGDDRVGILAGDMNARPETPAMQILAKHWIDTIVDPPPDPAARPRRRIDYVLVRPAAAWRIIEARQVEAPNASDHQPVLVVLEQVETVPRATRRER
jgi:endonuclease/exonuclease/phosphatase family metal-dependent hydrolase